EKEHSFFAARKVKQAFETAVRLDPRNVEAHRDLMQYLVEAPWIVGGDKEKAKQEIDVISRLDPVEGRLARAAYWTEDKKWTEARSEYLAVIEQRPSRIDPYMEAAEFFSDRKDATNLERVLAGAQKVSPQDPRLNFYRAVVMILRRTDLSTAHDLLSAY